MKKGIGFYFGVFATVFALIVVGFILGYMYAPEQVPSESNVKKFESLPKDVKLRYVLREDVPELAKYLKLDPKEITLVDEPIDGSEYELKAQIKTLREKNLALYQDNVDLSDKNWEISQNLQEQKKAIQEEKRILQSKSIATMNEAEKQHYKNVNDLTKRINDLQQEAIASTKNYETQIIDLENQVDKLKQAIQKKDTQIDEEVSVATQKERVNNSTLAEKNRYLVEQTKLMKSKLEDAYSKSSQQMRAKKDEILKLKDAINKKEAKLNVLLMKHTEEILQLEQKNSSSLNELKLTIRSIQAKHKDEISVKNQEIADLMLKQKKELMKFRKKIEEKESGVIAKAKESEVSNEAIVSLQVEVQKLKKDKENLAKQLKESYDKIKIVEASKEQDYVKMLSKIRSSLSGDRDSANKTIQELQSRILEAASIIDNLKDEKNSLLNEIDGFKEKDKTQVSSKILDESEAKHAKNYSILNEKIANLELEKKRIYDEAKKQVQEIRDSISKSKKAEQKDSALVASMQKELDTLRIENKNLKSKDKNATNQAAQKESEKIAILQKDLQSLKDENEQLKSSKDSGKENFKKKYEFVKEELKTAAIKVIESQRETQRVVVENERLAKENRALKSDASKEDVVSLDLGKKIKELVLQNRDLDKKLREKEDTIDKLTTQNTAFKKGENTQLATLETNVNRTSEELKEAKERVAKLEDKAQKLQTINTTLTSENSSLKLKSENELSAFKVKYDNAEKSLKSKDEELVKVKDELNKISNENTRLVAKSSSLQKQLDKKLETLENRFKSANETLKYSQDKVMNYKDQMASLEKENGSLLKENEALRVENKNTQKIYEKKIEKINSKLDISNKLIEASNAEVATLKESIATLEKKNSEIKALNTNLKTAKTDKVEDKKNLQSKLDESLNDLRNRRAEIMALKNDIQTLREKNELLQNQTDTLKSMQSENVNDDSKKIAQTQIATLKDDIKKLKSLNTLLTSQLKKEKSAKSSMPAIPTPKKSKPSKPILVASVKCDDMPKGTNSPTLSCKNEVAKFLGKYDAGYFFEVVPIVDNGGFATLEKVQNSKLNVPKSEINRLTRLSNIGLGKDRAAAGGKLIRAKFGDVARISYSVSNMDIAKKRGFVIRAYK